jgi:galactitol-specific phosphotransferase system IIB component
MKMKINHLKIFIIISLLFASGCSSNKEEQTREIRFVDLQGNAKAIKTRVPEANARIMSGQSQNSSESSEYATNKKSFVEAPNYYDKNLINQKNFNTPKFSDVDNVKKTTPIISSKDTLVSTNNSSNQDSVEESTNNPVVEYDLSEDDGKNNKNISKNNYSQKDFGKNLDSESTESTSTTSKKSRSINSNEEEFVEDDQFADSSSTTINSSNKKLLNQKNKVITYSNKKNKKVNKKVAKSNVIVTSEETADQSQNNEESTQRIYQGGGSGKIYVQVGSFFTSMGAKERLVLTKEFGKGRVLVAYNKNNKRIYRSVYGPFKSKNSAIKFKDKIIDSGNEAIIIRGK